MKKIIPLLLAAGAAMSFAAKAPITVIGDNYAHEGDNFHSPDFILKNTGTKDIVGFKIYAYVATNDVGLNPMDYLTKDANSVQPTYTYQKMNEHIFRIEMTFKNTIIPVGETFPENTNKVKDASEDDGATNYNRFFYLHKKASGKTTTTWFPYPSRTSGMRNIVVTDLNGNRLTATGHPFNATRKRYGVIQTLKTTACPSGYLYDNLIKIESEYFGNNSYRQGSKSQGIIIYDTFVNMFLCGQEGSVLTRGPFDYAVVSFDDECPANGYRFTRHHDAEDLNPENKKTGLDWATKVGKDVDISFCFVPADDDPGVSYPVHKDYGVFANYTNNYIEHSLVHVDDEDTSNKNKWILSDAAKKYESRIKMIMSGTKDTDYHIVKMLDAPMAKASAKSSVASVEKVENVASEIPAAAVSVAKPASSAAIKNVNRTTVGIELKTAGNVDVTIAGIDGHVYAKVSASNLQAGAHNLNWNVANIPAGHYIVSVKHNGNISGKNVILK